MLNINFNGMFFKKKFFSIMTDKYLWANSAAYISSEFILFMWLCQTLPYCMTYKYPTPEAVVVIFRPNPLLHAMCLMHSVWNH